MSDVTLRLALHLVAGRPPDLRQTRSKVSLLWAIEWRAFSSKPPHKTLKWGPFIEQVCWLDCIIKHLQRVAFHWMFVSPLRPYAQHWHQNSLGFTVCLAFYLAPLKFKADSIPVRQQSLQSHPQTWLAMDHFGYQNNIFVQQHMFNSFTCHMQKHLRFYYIFQPILQPS